MPASRHSDACLQTRTRQNQLRTTQVKPEEGTTSRRRPGRPTRNTEPYLANKKRAYWKVYHEIETAISHHRDNTQPLNIFENLKDETPEDAVDYAQRNLKIIEEQYHQCQLQNYFTMGEALHSAMVNQMTEHPDDVTNPAEVGTYLGINNPVIVRRVYELFKLWPQAIGHIRKLKVSDINKLDTEQLSSVQLKLQLEFASENSEPLFIR